MKKHLVIQWVNDNPIIDGACYYDTIEDATQSCEIQKELSKKNTSLLNKVEVRYTICTVHRGRKIIETKNLGDEQISNFCEHKMVRNIEEDYNDKCRLCGKPYKKKYGKRNTKPRLGSK